MKLLFITIFLSLNAYSQNTEITPELLAKFHKAEAVNMDEVVSELKLIRYPKQNSKHYKIANPFYPKTRVYPDYVELMKPINGQTDFIAHEDGTVSFHHQRAVYNWYNVKPKFLRDAEVCGFKFTNADKTKYHLKTFRHKVEALAQGYIVTHQFHCGACSSLKDLAVYLGKRNMVVDGRKCAKKLTPLASKKCHLRRIGLTEYCAESWAYNAIATRKNCMKTCLNEYGLINTLLGKFPDSYVNPDGTLKPCILCDELRSGGGYRYSSGRTRRSSGIVSAIDRGNEEIYPLDFKTYYKAFELPIPQVSK